MTTESHLKTLQNLLINSAASFIFINGPAECGKSHLLHSLTEIEQLNALYIDSLECFTMTILYERLLSFLTLKLTKNHVKPVGKLCSTVTEMVTKLSDLKWPANFKIVILIDEADRLFQLDSNSFSVLLRLPEMFDYKISIVMASREEFDDFGPAGTSGLVPIKITLPSFPSETICQIICDQLESEEPASAAKRVKNCFNLVKQVSNVTVKDLSVLRNLTASALNANVNITSSNGKIVNYIQSCLDASNQLDPFYQQTSNSLNLIEKYLLISGFIASFQTAREDLKIFWSSQSTSKRKSKKLFNPAKDVSNNNKNVDKLTLKLPKLFDQTRLIAILYHNIQGIDPLPSPQQLQLTIKSLCDRGLFKAAGNPSATKIDSLKYRINISQDFAVKLAKGLDIELKNLLV